MIVDADFPTHWKTRQLVAELGESAPMAIICLWCHCQQRRVDVMRLTPTKLAAICNWQGDPEALFLIMVRDEWLDDLGENSYRVHGWRERNRMITSKWGNENAVSNPKKKQVESKLNPTCNEVETTPFISNPILSSTEDRESEGKEKVKPKKTAAWRKQKSTKPMTDDQLALGALFGRRKTNPWENGLCETLEGIKAGLPPEEWERQLADIVAYYTPSTLPGDFDPRRHDLPTLLNNWSGELDRAALNTPRPKK